MTTESKLDQLHFLIEKALITIGNEKQDLYNKASTALTERNNAEEKVTHIAKMFMPKGQTYIYNCTSSEQYDELIRILENMND